MTVPLSPRFAGWLLLSAVACKGRSPTEPVATVAPGSIEQKAVTSGSARRPAVRVVSPRANVPQRVKGSWGGDHVGLTITDDAVTIDFDCAVGSIEGPFVTDPAGRFDLVGSWWFTPPVIFQEWLPEKRPARYWGVVDDGIMTLIVVRLDDNQPLGTFTLAVDQTPRLLRCV
jgi:hypothetical protein